jgi:hypothetical protein
MNGCNRVQANLTEYLDGQLNGRQMQEISSHLGQCRDCDREWKSLQGVQSALAGLGPMPAPANLPLRIRVALSQERARSRRSPFAALTLVWKNSIGPFLLQASAGLASAVLLMGTVIMLITMFAQPESANAAPDEPLGNASAPRLLYFSNAQGGNEIGSIDGPVWVQVYVNGQGEVYDFRIVSGPDDEATRSHVENLLLFGRFEPARFFGQPVRGMTVLLFSGVNVRG